MIRKYIYIGGLITFLLLGIVGGILIRNNNKIWGKIRNQLIDFPFVKSSWPKEFTVEKIPSVTDANIQEAYLYKTTAVSPQPLIVSLHSWSWSYYTEDSLAQLAKSKNINYIRPDFRGPYLSVESCCSELVISDIDNAIAYAIKNANVDTTNIFVIGISGGGYTALCTFMKSKHAIKKFSVWIPVTDLLAFYQYNKNRKGRYENTILNCTDSSTNQLNVEEAKERSPIYMKTPVDKLTNSNLTIYAGSYDGIEIKSEQAPLTQSIDFYNKLLKDRQVADSSVYVSDKEKLSLLVERRKLGNYGQIEDREIFLIKNHLNTKLVIFEGGHEVFTKYAFETLTK